MVDYGWCNRAEMVDLSGIGRVELNGRDIVGQVWKSCIEYGSARDGSGGFPEKNCGDGNVFNICTKVSVLKIAKVASITLKLNQR